MSRIFVHGCGVVSPAGWGLASFRGQLEQGQAPSTSNFQRPDRTELPVFRVPPPPARPAWLAQPRLRRSSPISHLAVAAAVEALGGGDRVPETPGLALVVCVQGGSVQYSRRFFAEALADPSTASPLLFPETVFNAPASHLGAVLGTSARNSTYVSDQAGFLAGLAMAADWLERGLADATLVVACEEADWTMAEASRLFSRRSRASEGAAAVLLRREIGPVELEGISSPRPFVQGRHPTEALTAIRRELGPAETVFSHGVRGSAGAIDPVFGDGLAAAGGWTCIAAIDALLQFRGKSAMALVAGSNLQALGVRFSRVHTAGELPLQPPANG